MKTPMEVRLKPDTTMNRVIVAVALAAAAVASGGHLAARSVASVKAEDVGLS